MKYVALLSSYDRINYIFVDATPGSSHTARSAAPTGSSSAPSHHAHEKKPIPY